MVKNNNLNFITISVISFSLIFGIIFRLYNLNFENFWLDEILTFWISDPTVTVSESYERHLNLEQTLN